MPAPDDQSSFLASLPAAVRAALQAQDVQALDLALRQMPSDEVEQRTAFLPPVVAAALAQAQANGNTDVVYEAPATLPPDEADRLYAQLQEQGML